MQPEVTVSPLTPLPPSYTFLPKGDRYKTLHSRKLTHTANLPLYIVVSEKKPLGIRIPSSILKQVNLQAKETLSTRRAATSKRDASDVAKAVAEIAKQFPRMPVEERARVVRHGFKKHSGRVGRTGRVGLDKKVVMAVMAHARHMHTEYDALLKGGMDRMEARKATWKKIDIVMKKWGYAKGGK
ncbi:alanine and arginine rich [Pyrenophora seminiperda CCB06]|uniref:Alanine and arginine rich n=1 Tax=Pyrenophora seminiperda CCB06 TaxID=1302712 RepID=A0A3M7M0U3_9PLEO|nr:alanine and arginine rich [Pyrenophora seminiperda CCB06]